jgi:hypothetical protein
MRILFLIFCLLSKVLLFPQYFDIQIDRVVILYQNPKMVEFNIKIRRVNRVRSAIGNVSYHVPIDNNMLCDLKLLKKQGNEYRYQPYRIPPNGLCEAFRTDGNFF